MVGNSDLSYGTLLFLKEHEPVVREMGLLGVPALSKVCHCEPSSQASFRDFKLSLQKQFLYPQIISKNSLCRDFQLPAVTWWS